MVKQVIRPWLHSAMACDRLACNRVCQITEKELEMGNKAVWSIGHMPNLQCCARLIVQWWSQRFTQVTWKVVSAWCMAENQWWKENNKKEKIGGNRRVSDEQAHQWPHLHQPCPNSPAMSPHYHHRTWMHWPHCICIHPIHQLGHFWHGRQCKSSHICQHHTHQPSTSWSHMASPPGVWLGEFWPIFGHNFFLYYSHFRKVKGILGCNQGGCIWGGGTCSREEWVREYPRREVPGVPARVLRTDCLLE